MMITIPPPPTCHDTRVAAGIEVKFVANLFDGHERIGHKCHKAPNNRRYVFARVIGPVPMFLRVTVWMTPEGDFRISARPVKKS